MICLGGALAIGLALTASIWFSVLSLLHSLFAEWHGPASLISTFAQSFQEHWAEVPTILWVVAYHSAICWHLANIAEAKEAQDVFQIMASDLSAGEIVLMLFGLAGIGIIAGSTYHYVSDSVGHGEPARLLASLAAGLWALLIGTILILMRRRSARQPSSPNRVNQ
jgi:hypothetical protein